MNLYAFSEDVFTGRHEQLAAALGASAEGAVTNADLSFSTRLQAAVTPERLGDTRIIDIAVGSSPRATEPDVGTAREHLLQAAARAGVTEAQAARAVAASHR